MSMRPPSLRGPVVVALSYLVGSIPFSGIVARLVRGVDLRRVGTGTVSGTGLYRVAGLGPLIVGGLLDVAKGAMGPTLARDHGWSTKTAAAAAVVCGHNWSVFLGGAGGRGISPALGAMSVMTPEGSALLLAGLALGKAVGATSLGAFGAYLGLVPLLTKTRGRRGTALAVSLVVPMLAKRVLGNRPPQAADTHRVLLNRLLFDQDTPRWPHLPRVSWR